MALFGKKSTDTPSSSGSGANSAPASGGTATAGEKKKGFGRGRKDSGAPAPAPAPATGGAGDTDEFFDFSDDALAAAGPATNGSAAPGADGGRGKKKVAKPKGLKSGTVVGLNIGTDSIKAIELRVKGSEIAITGMGMLPTPEDSIANGVVMSVASLSHAIRDVLQQAGIKTKRVVTSVAGTGALVVRVIEVPKMSDSELEDNMKVDADRYIPFPPSEVIMDFKALRDLPTDPDAPNMEVLLAAAQREIIDLHVQVMEGAKLDPRSIDVEPLAAVRALTARETNPNAAAASTLDGVDYVDYNDVTAVVNIGASSTEISIVRGDILVFTRNVPTGGQTMTQAIVDYFGLHWPDAEHAKRQWGDALPHPVASPAPVDYGAPAGGAAPVDILDDWSEFGLEDTTLDAAATGFDAPATPQPTIQLDKPSAGAFDADPFADTSVTGATPSGAATPTGAAAQTASQPVDPFDLDFNANAPAPGNTTQTADPFDLDFFSQGPQDTQQKEPGEQHGQKEDENDEKTPGGNAAGSDDNSAPGFDFSDFSFDDDGPAGAGTSAGGGTKLPTRQGVDFSALGSDDMDDEDSLLPTSTVATSQPVAVPSAFDFPSAAGPFSAADDDESTLPTVRSGSESDATVSSVAGIDGASREDEQDATLPTLAGAASALSTPALSTAAVSTPVTPTTGASTFSLGKTEDDIPKTNDAGGASTPDEPEVESFDFDLTPNAAPAPVATNAPHTPLVLDKVEDEDDFDIDSLFGDSAAPAAGTAAVTTPHVDGDGAAGIDLTLDKAPATASAAAMPDTDDFGGFEDSLEGFGAGLTDTHLSGIDEQALFGVLSPILEGLSGEIRRSLEYHATRYPDAAVHHITLVGGGAKLKNIDAYFTQSLGIPTTVGNPLAGLTVQAPKLPQAYPAEMGPLFVVALGLALRDLVR